ncbi:MAG: PA2169 family four-helix-bundle protein [Burkholderiales bacterium]|nr:PA2169 family four-helix-bundle protein [Burkholderiales bacterium]
MSERDIFHKVNRLIETCKDGEFGFRSCANHAKDPGLRTLFSRRADDCKLAASELRTLVGDLGGIPEDSGSAGGAMHRGWVAVKGTLTGYSDQMLLEECERGEDQAMRCYNDALQSELTSAIRAVVERQYAGVKNNHAQIRSLRDQERARAA